MSLMLDTFRPDVAAVDAAKLYADGYRAVAFYLFESSAFKRPLTRQEAVECSKAGLWIVSVFENGTPTSPGYFTAGRGRMDGSIAAAKAELAGQPGGSVIYFAVDYDASSADLPSIDAYFDAVRAGLGGAYDVGVYGSGLVCMHLRNGGRVSKTWLAQSRGFASFAAWESHADIVQGPECSVLGMDIDSDQTAASGGGGWQVFA